MLQQTNCLKAGASHMARTPKPNGLKYLRKTAKGRVYYYHPNGTRLHGEPNTPEFAQSWVDARGKIAIPSTRTLTALVDAFEASPAFTKLADSTKTEWRRWLERFRVQFEGLPLKAIEGAKFLDLFEKYREQWADKPATADYALKVFNRLITWGNSRGWVQRGPLKLERWSTEDRAGFVWSQEQLDQLLTCEFSRKFPHFANVVKFAVLSGWRQGDILNLTWAELDAGGRKGTRKSAGRLGAALIYTKALKSLLSTFKREPDQVFVFPTPKGPKWSALGFRAYFHKAREDAGLADTGLRFHDLRGTFVGIAVQAGIPLEEVARFIGWSPTRAVRISSAYIGKDVLAASYARAIDAKLKTLQKTKVSQQGETYENP
jgi:integrase